MNKIILISLIFLSSNVFAQKENTNKVIDNENIKYSDKRLKESTVRIITPEMIIEVDNSKANELVDKIIEVNIEKEELLKQSYILEHEIAILELKHKKDKLEDELKLYSETREQKVKFSIEKEKNDINKLSKSLEKITTEMSIPEKVAYSNDKLFDSNEVLNVSADGIVLKVKNKNK